MRLTAAIMVVVAALVVLLAGPSSSFARGGDSCSRGCTKEYKPVCGSDSRVYPNPCVFEIARCRNPGLYPKVCNAPKRG